MFETELTIREFFEELGITKQTVYNHLRDLSNEGVIDTERTKNYKGTIVLTIPEQIELYKSIIGKDPDIQNINLDLENISENTKDDKEISENTNDIHNNDDTVSDLRNELKLLRQELKYKSSLIEEQRSLIESNRVEISEFQVQLASANKIADQAQQLQLKSQYQLDIATAKYEQLQLEAQKQLEETIDEKNNSINELNDKLNILSEENQKLKQKSEKGFFKRLFGL